MENQYFAVKTRLEFKDGRIVEGYAAYDFENDDISFTSPAGSDSACLYMTSETAGTIAKLIRNAVKLTKKANGFKKTSVRVERVKAGGPWRDVLRNCKNGAAHYYIAACI